MNADPNLSQDEIAKRLNETFKSLDITSAPLSHNIDSVLVLDASVHTLGTSDTKLNRSRVIGVELDTMRDGMI
jgi:hypothetical protein